MCTLFVVLMMFMVTQSCTTTQGAPVSSQVLHEVLDAFKQAISSDPRGALASWDTSNQSSNPCSGSWTGLQCHVYSNIATITSINIDLSNQSLQGSITPQLSRLSGALVSLDLSYNSLSGTITFLSNFSSSGDSLLQYLVLHYNHLHGPFSLPPSCFPRLINLSIAENSFSGSLPSEALSRCPSLLTLNVSNNLFTGPLFPTGLGNLTTTVQNLDAGRNNLSGPIPSSVGNCSALTFLSLTFNHFSSALPSAFGLGCPKLWFLSLFNNRLSGDIPREMGLLSKLSYLSIGLNNFSGEVLQTLANCSSLSLVHIGSMSLTGSMPADFGSRLPSLDILILESNMFTGAIPPALFRAWSITQLDLRFNSFSGNIPPEIRNLSSLQKAHFNNNKFTGSLPEELGMLVSLQVLALEHNYFSGYFPNQLFNCTGLLGLSVNDNGVAGPISSAIGLLLNLESFDASSNKLTGQLPLGLANCTILQNFSVGNNILFGEIPKTVVAGLSACLSFNASRNNLSGSIPDAEFQKMMYLNTLDLSHNELSGAIPSGLADCADLSFVYLSQNTLSGPIPSALGASLHSLVELSLSHNSINGSIPTELNGLQSLQHLDLSDNALSGTIPPALAQIKSLQFLNLSYNRQLEGMIPIGGVFTKLTSTSFLGDPMLCGAAINMPCSKSDDGSPSKLEIIIIAVGTAAVILFILGFLVAVVLNSRQRSASSELWSFSPYPRLTLEDIERATGNFSEDNILGVGATGTVYKGTLKDGTTLAFKKFKLDPSSVLSFARELKSVGLIKHRNLVKIVGYYSNHLDTIILILEYMPNGNLESHLHGRNHEESLSWHARVQVAVSVAQGLLYLHEYCPAPIIHCDLKPENILFDADMEARITDFGLANVMTFTTASRLTDNKQGTLGYMAPELASYGHISRKCDVYSYGILLVEMITGRRPFEEVQMMQVSSEEDAQGAKTLVQWVASMFEADKIQTILDKSLQARCDSDGGVDEIDQMKKLLDLALQCTQENPRHRPTMLDVVHALLSITSIAPALPLEKSQIIQEVFPLSRMEKNPRNNSFSIGPSPVRASTSND